MSGEEEVVPVVGTAESSLIDFGDEIAEEPIEAVNSVSDSEESDFGSETDEESIEAVNAVPNVEETDFESEIPEEPIEEVHTAQNAEETAEEENSASVPAEGKEEEPVKKQRIHFNFGSEPPTVKDAKKTTVILDRGKVIKERKGLMSFYNSSRRVPQDERAENEQGVEEEDEQYIGREFVNEAYGQQGTRFSRPSQHYNSSSRSYARRETNYSNYYPKYPNWDRPRDRIDFNSFGVMKDQKVERYESKRIEENTLKAHQNKYFEAIPEDLIWKSIGKHTEYIPINKICPHWAHMGHIKFKAEDQEAEKSRMNLLYSMICESGIIHVEELWKLYLKRNKIEDHPFDGYTHFCRFITERAHVFGMDQNQMVYNQNLLVTLAVLRYVHALYHGSTPSDASELFTAHGKRLFRRAFLSCMSKDNLSYDIFFRNFPALFEYDEPNSKWTVNESSVSRIPSAFLPDCLPRRNHTTPYLDRSILFNGTGKVIVNNIVGIKILSDDSFRNDIRYVVGVPVELIDDPLQYPKDTLVAFTGVRYYNSKKETVYGTTIQHRVTQTKPNYQASLDLFAVEDEEEGKCVESKKMHEPTREAAVRISQEKHQVASSEKEKLAAIKKALKKGDVEIYTLFDRVKHLFFNDFQLFFVYLEMRPYYFKSYDSNGKVLVSKIPLEARLAMTKLLVELDKGNEGRPWKKDEVKERCTSLNSSLVESDQFTLEDLKLVLDYRRMVVTSEGTPKVITTVSPLCFWEHKENVLIHV